MLWRTPLGLMRSKKAVGWNRNALLRMLGLAVVPPLGCASAIRPDSIKVEALVLDDATLFIKIDNNRPASFMYIADSNVARKDGVIRVTFFQRALHHDANDNVEVPGVVLRVWPDDREVRITDGKHERIVWHRTP